MKKWLVRIVLILLLGLSTILLLDLLVTSNAAENIHNDITTLPTKKVGLLLGTGKHLGNGTINRYYKYRVDAAIALYQAGKVKYILISGDNSSLGYDEPTSMKEDLMAAGVPESAIYLDYAGFRTLDSIVRCKKIFGESDILIISQQFHNERAIYIAEANDMKAIGYSAQDVSGRGGLKTNLREYLARTKMFLDLWLGKEPKFLGERIKID